MKKRLLTLLFFMLLASSISCTRYRLGDLTLLSTKNFELNQIEKMKIKYDTFISGKDGYINILGFPTGSPIPNWKESIDNTIEQEENCIGLVNVTFYLEMNFYFLCDETYYVTKSNPIILNLK